MLVHPRRNFAGLTAVALLHVALLWFATRPVPNLQTQDERVWIQLLRTAPPLPKAVPVQTMRVPAAQTSPKRLAEAAPAPAVPAAQSAPAPSETPEELALLADPQAALPSDVKQQMLKIAGAIDRELRAQQRQGFSAPVDTPATRLAKGMAAAHAAVKPKWYEAARVELFSAPNDPKRIYRVITATGEYCLFYPDKGSISANSNPKSGWASFGQPTASTCPIPF